MDKSKRVYVGPVGFDRLTWKESLLEFEKLFDTPGQHQIAKVNPEFIVTAMRSQKVRAVINACSLVLPDGVGILWASEISHDRGFKRVMRGLFLLPAIIFSPKRIHRVLPERIPGVPYFLEVLRICAEENAAVYLLGGVDQARLGTIKYLDKEFPSLRVAGHSGSMNPFEDANRLVDEVNASGAEVLFVAFGHPLQEEWISENLGRMPKIKIANGEGGTFDFLSGVQKRAPRFLQKLGLEWTWRFAKNPIKRAKKMWLSVPVFIWLILRNKH